MANISKALPDTTIEIAATRVAQAVDRERGWIDDDGQGIGYAETLGGIAIKLRGEVEGPAGRD